jgi:hypothetical protein
VAGDARGPRDGGGGLERAQWVTLRLHQVPERNDGSNLHTHTADTSAVVLAGRFGSVEDGGSVKLGGSGSYQFVPGGLKHTTECGADADCVIFSCQPGAFDLVPAGGAKK